MKINNRFNVIKSLLSTYKGAAFFSFYSFINSALNFVLLLSIANLLSSTGYGELNLYTTLVTLLGFFISLNSAGYISTVFFYKRKESIRKLINVCIILTTIVLIFYFFILTVCSCFKDTIFNIPILYAMIAGVVCYSQLFTTIILDIWRLESNLKNYGLFSCSVVVFRVLLTIIIIKISDNWVGFPISQFIITLMAAICAILFLIHKDYLKCELPSKKEFLETLRFGIPLIPHSISSWIRQGFDRYVISIYYPFGIVGEYSLCFNIANIIHILGLAFNSYFSVFLYKELSKDEHVDESRKKLRRQTIQITYFFIIVTIIGIFLSKILCPVLFPQYNISLLILIPLCFSAFFQSIYYLFVNYLFFFKKTVILMYITVSISFIHLLLSIFLIKISVIYAAYITLASNALITILVILYSKKLYSLSIIK